jgi:hypothetical protein
LASYRHGLEGKSRAGRSSWFDAYASATGTATTTAAAAATARGATAVALGGTLAVGDVRLLTSRLGLAGELDRDLALQDLLAGKLGDGALGLGGSGEVDEGVADGAVGAGVLGDGDGLAVLWSALDDGSFAGRPWMELGMMQTGCERNNRRREVARGPAVWRRRKGRRGKGGGEL